VGDWIVYSLAENPVAYKIIEVNGDYYKIEPGKNNLGFSRKNESDLRLATSEEIQKSALVKPNSFTLSQYIDPFLLQLVIAFLIIAVLWYNFSPFFDLPEKVRIGAICNDGSYSNATGPGACSYHGGVSAWEYTERPHKTGVLKKIIISIIISWMMVFKVLAFLGILKEKLIKKS